MRNLELLNAFRVRIQGEWAGDDRCGAFRIASPVDRAPMMVVASSDLGWDHVSVSRKNRCPNWTEMEKVAELFFKDDEVAMQLHVPSTDHISNHPHCLHWWRPHDKEIPRPPAIFVGVKELGDLSNADPAAIEMLRAVAGQILVEGKP